jgi:predicted deacetylase
MRHAERIAVAIHGIEPATFERSALIRDWLDDHGIDRVTLLVIPARDLHPLADRGPDVAAWLRERAAGGDAIAQHGFHQGDRRGGSWPRRAMLGESAEFHGLDPSDTRRAVHAGWRVLKLAGIEPSGFVAPAYAYTEALHDALHPRFRWWAGLLRLHSAAGDQLAPALPLQGASALRRALSPALVTAGSLLCGETLRVDLHAADLACPRHMLALEGVLRRAGGRRTAVTYDELALAA